MAKFRVSAGLDLSLRCSGVAIITAPKEASYFTWGYKLPAKASHIDIQERVIYIATNIMKVLKQYNCADVGIENYAYATKGRISMLADLGGTIKSQIYINGRMPIILASGSIRKYLLVRSKQGRNIKATVADRLVDLGYRKPGNYDESDALAVAHVVSKWANDRQDASTEAQLEVFENIDDHLTRANHSPSRMANNNDQLRSSACQS